MIHYPQEIPGFTLEKEQYYPEYQMTMALYRNKKYGFPFLTAKNEADTHNSFTIVFKTPAIDDSGCNHMLEHMVLQGSDKYPIRDVFNELYKRSFATYMNAGTSQDYTEYPFATTNEKDFFSSLDVYLDATFHPRLSEIEFRKECHSITFQDNDPSKPLIHSGVVYNEMCGDFSSPSTRYLNDCFRNLYPESSIKYIFGGDPKMIAKSSVEDLRRTHHRFYHPHNAYFIHYGTFDINQIATKICEAVDSFPVEFEPLDPSLFEQPRWTEPHKCYIPTPLSEMAGPHDRQYRATVAWLTIPLIEDQRVTDLSFLIAFLYESKNSVFFKRFIKSGRATSLGFTGFHTWNNNPPFILEINGCDKETAENFEAEVMEILTDLEQNGIDPEIIQSTIHQNDLYIRKPTANFGIKQFLPFLASGFFHGADPFRLVGNSEIDRIKQAYKENPRYYQDVIKKYLLNNPHRLFSIGVPTPGIIEKDNQVVTAELEEMKAKMTEEQLQKLKDEAKEMEDYLKEPLPLSKLPQIRRTDMIQESEYTPVSLTSCNGKINIIKQPTRGLTFLTMKVSPDFNSQYLIDHPEYYLFFTVFSSLYGHLGVGDKNDEEWAQYIDSFSSEVYSIQLVTSSMKNDVAKNDSFWRFCVYFMNEDLNKAANALKQFIYEPKFDDLSLIETHIRRIFFKKAQSFNDVAYLYAILLGQIGETQHPTLLLEELWRGLSYLRYLNQIIQENDWEKISKQMKEIHQQIFLNSYFSILTSCDNEQAENVITELTPIFENLGRNAPPEPNTTLPESLKSYLFVDTSKIPDQKLFLQTETNTNYCTLVADCVCRIHLNNPVFSIMEKILINEFLFNEIRVKLGAYGIEGYCDSLLGKLVHYTYRDQHADACLKAIQSGIDDIANGKIDDVMIERALIKIFSQMDRPEPPQAKGVFHWMHGITKEETQQRRTTTYNVTKEDIVNAAKFLKAQKWSQVVVSSSSIEPPPSGFTVISAKVIENSEKNDEEEENEE